MDMSPSVFACFPCTHIHVLPYNSPGIISSLNGNDATILQQNLPPRNLDGSAPFSSRCTMVFTRFVDGHRNIPIPFAPPRRPDGDTWRIDHFLREDESWEGVTRQSPSLIGRVVMRLPPVEKDSAHLELACTLLSALSVWLLAMRSTAMDHAQLLQHVRTLTPVNIVNNQHIPISQVHTWRKPRGVHVHGIHPLVAACWYLQQLHDNDQAAVVIPEMHMNAAGGHRLGEPLWGDAGPAFRMPHNWKYLPRPAVPAGFVGGGPARVEFDARMFRVFGTDRPIQQLNIGPQLYAFKLSCKEKGGVHALAGINLFGKSACCVNDGSFDIPLQGGNVNVRPLNFREDVPMGVRDPNTPLLAIPRQGLQLELVHAVRWGQTPMDSVIIDRLAPPFLKDYGESGFTKTIQHVVRAELFGCPHTPPSVYQFSFVRIHGFCIY